ncbi:MAG: hypothetical protein ACREFE_18005 [Limisphaerales bacterium]
MLKRNGEDCEHAVPNYPGLLTTTELKAYNVAVPTVAEPVRLFNERARTLSEIENQSAKIAEQVASQSPSGLPSLAITAKGMPEATWQINQTLFKSPRSEILLCSRDIGEKKQFGVVEKFAPNSPYARVHGETDLQMTGNNTFVLLQNYVESERGVLQLFRKDIEATVEENLSERFPGQNHSRVVRAISARCESQAPVEAEKEKPARSVKIRM